MRRNAVIFMLAVVVMLISSPVPSAASGAEVSIAGDPCSVPLITRLAEAYSAQESGFSATISTFSCTLGVYKAAEGEVDIGVSTQNGLSENLPRGGVNTVITRSPVVLIVNRENPVDGLTYDQVRGIYSGEIRNWKQVGGPDAEIKNVMLEPCVMHSVSKQTVPYAPDLEKLTPGRKVNPVDYTNTLVAGDSAALGQQIYGYEGGGVKVLMIDGVLPGEETLPGRYTFYQDYNVVTHGEPEGIVKGFIDYALSEDGAEVMRSLSHVPLKNTGSITPSQTTTPR